jgi:hypothetical protein
MSPEFTGAGRFGMVAPGVEPVVLTSEQAARVDELERRLAAGDPALAVFMLTELEAQYGIR